MTDIRTFLSAWHTERNNTPDEQLDALDSRHAREMGLPTLAALLTLSDELQRRARGRALMVELGIDALLHTACGEANARLRHMTSDDRLTVPGLSAAVSCLEESETPEQLAARMGALGGASTSRAKRAASRANGRKGGRPKKEVGQ